MLNSSMLGYTCWEEALEGEFSKEYFVKFNDFLLKRQLQVPIYPPPEQIFEWSKHCPVNCVKVVILGQDPYSKQGLATGSCFSVPTNQPIPRSLHKIFKEMVRDIGFEYPSHGDLTKWAQQGVLLLNYALTVEDGNPGSHKKYWKSFTDAIIECINQKCQGVVFMLWGTFAKSKKRLINEQQHCVLEACHPVFRNNFQGCSHFSKANEILLAQGKRMINWSL